MQVERAECGNLSQLLAQLGKDLDRYLCFEHPDAMSNCESWKSVLGGALPEQGVGAQKLVAEIGRHVIPNGSAIPKPGCTSFITTGTTSVGALALLSSAVAGPQRFGLTAFNFLEELSLEWMADLFELPACMKGLYSSGGSVANLVALGAARQSAFEKLGIDASRDGVYMPACIYASTGSHHSVHRAAAVLGLGRSSVKAVPVDGQGRLCAVSLREQLTTDLQKGIVPMAIVATAGSTSTGAIDPLADIGEIAAEHDIWFHVDGAYGLPGILDPRVKHLYKGLALADSVTVDPHKWLGAPVGIGATYIRDRNIQKRAFTQESAPYLESALENGSEVNSMDGFGIPYDEFGVELSAPSRGAVVWALIREIGAQGLRERVCRHNAMARHLARLVSAHTRMELVQQPQLSICCFRYVTQAGSNLNDLNRRIHRALVQRGINIPSATVIDGKFVIRPCFIGARTQWQQVGDLFAEVIHIGDQLSSTDDQHTGIAGEK
jgi:aromatic-L-amino-acid decarboxylase